MVEVQKLLDAMLLCPIVDGKRLILVGDAVTNEDSHLSPASAAPVVDTRTEIVRRIALARSEKANAERSGYDRDALRLDGAVGVLENLLEDIDIAAATAAPVEQSGDAIEPARGREWIRKAANELYNSGCGHVMDVSEIETIIGHCWADSAPQPKT